MNFARLLWDAAAASPDRVALSDGEQRITYAAFAQRASAVRDHLVGLGVAPGERVAVLLPHGVEAAIAFYGAVAAGAMVTMLHWQSKPRQVEQALRNAEAKVLIISDEWERQQARPIESATLRVTFASVDATGTGGPVARALADPAQISYTSGSTGTPKGVVTTHANLWAGVRTVVGYLGIRESDRIASLLPFSFVYGFSQLNCAIAMGARLEIIASPLANEIVHELIDRECTVLAAVPPLWTQLLRVSDFTRPIPALRLVTCAGGRLNPDAVRALRAAQPQAKVFLMYGLTEVFRSTFLAPEEVDAYPGSMGRAVPGASVRVLREDGSECDAGEVGELVHAGPTVALGYWRDPESTARVFRPNAFPEGSDPELARAVHSGDLVRRDPEGRLFYVGRRDRMIKSLGFRLSPDEVTDVLLASKMVSDAVVTSEPDEHRGERIVAHVVLNPGASLEAVRRWAGMELPRHMVPARWDVREQMPRNANGKYDLTALTASADH